MATTGSCVGGLRPCRRVVARGRPAQPEDGEITQNPDSGEDDLLQITTPAANNQDLEPAAAAPKVSTLPVPAPARSLQFLPHQLVKRRPLRTGPDGEDERQPHRDGEAGRAVEEGAVLLDQRGEHRNAGEDRQEAGDAVAGAPLCMLIQQQAGRGCEEDGAGLPENN